MIYEIEKKDLKNINIPFIDFNLEEEFKNNPFARLLVLKEKDEIIGYLYYSDIYDRAEINQFEISFIHRNCGKGKILMDYFTKHVDKNITLEVKSDNLPAVKIYEKYGFVKVATRKNYYNGIDGILMERNKTPTR